jgi:DNA-binding IclR family transcriptional regulator
LSDLAAEMNIPISSCFTLVRNLLSEGYIFEPYERKSYYPTGKLRSWMTIIGENDPISHRIDPILERIRDQCGETVTLGQLSGKSVVYIAKADSLKPIRMVVRIGIKRPIHTVAMGKALLSLMSPEKRAAFLKKYNFEQLRPATRTSLAALECDIREGAQRGYFISREESVEDAMAVATPVKIAGQDYAFQIAGPRARVEAGLETIVTSLAEATAALSGHEG